MNLRPSHITRSPSPSGRPEWRGLRRLVSQSGIAALLLVLAVLTLVPLYMTALTSQKTTGEILLHFWDLPRTLHVDYYVDSARFLAHYILNSIIVAALVVSGVLLLSSLAAYAFARIAFPGKDTLFILILSLIMIPGILTLVPAFQWIKTFPFVGGNSWAGEDGSGFYNTRWALILPAIAGGQVMSIFLLRPFFQSIPTSLFDAARLDGASELRTWWHIALPLSMPIMATVAVLQFAGVYNSYVWPLIVISDDAKQVFAVGVTKLSDQGGITEMGVTMAGYVVGSIPLVAVLVLGMRHFVEGLTHGALKG